MNRERIGLIDLGSNSARFIIMELLENGAHHLIYQDKRTVRLSEGLSDTGSLTPLARSRTLEALENFAETATRFGVEKMLAVATAAMRRAKNGEAFQQEVFDKTGIPLTIISGREEARLGYLGVSRSIAEDHFILFDLGGASMEVSLIHHGQLVEAQSLPIGALTLTETYGTSDRMSREARQAIIEDVKNALELIPGIQRAHLPVVGIGGTVRNLAKIHQRKVNYPIPKLHHYRMTVDDIVQMEQRFSRKSFHERAQISGLGAARADIITAGTLTIRTLLEYADATSLLISGCGLREGLFHHYYEENHPAWYKQHMPLWVESVTNYRNTLPLGDDDDMEIITSLALSLYDHLQTIHHYPSRIRALLEASARLSDTGKLINYYSYAKHSAYIIANAPLYGLEHHEQALVAIVAGFQDGISNKIRRFATYARLLNEGDMDIAKRISVLLAIAKVLCHITNHEPAVRIEKKKNAVIAHVTLTDETDASLLNNALAPHQKTFHDLYRVPLQFHWHIES